MTKKKILKTLALALSMSLLAPFASKVEAKESANNVNIVSEAAIVMDYDTGEIVYEKNANEHMYLASTTKLMTALLFAENNKKTDSITYTQTALDQPPYTLNSEKMKPYGKSFKVGDTLSADVVMDGLLLFSGNDVAYMIADEVGGNKEGFVKMMNERADKLGLKDTHFENPNGLPENGKDVNYSTAYELALITKEAYSNQWVKDTMAQSEVNVVLPGDTNVKLENRNTELGTNGNLGGKTGVTDMAGTCFAGVYERNGKKYIGVVLKCDRNDNNKRFEDLDSMMDYSEKAEKYTYKSSGDEIGNVTLNYKLFGFFGPEKTIDAPVVLSEDAKIYDNDINNEESTITYNTEETSAWKAASSDQVPLTLSIKQYSTELKGKVKLSKMDLIKANLLIYLASLAIIIIIIVLIIFIIKMIKGNKRRRSSYSRRRRRY